MLTDKCLLLRRFFQNALGHNVRGGFFCNNNLGETVGDMFQRIGHKAELRIVKNFLLYAKNDAEFRLGTHLA